MTCDRPHVEVLSAQYGPVVGGVRGAVPVVVKIRPRLELNQTDIIRPQSVNDFQNEFHFQEQARIVLESPQRRPDGLSRVRVPSIRIWRSYETGDILIMDQVPESIVSHSLVLLF